jgi:hypothetical protein
MTQSSSHSQILPVLARQNSGISGPNGGKRETWKHKESHQFGHALINVGGFGNNILFSDDKYAKRY